MIYKYVNGELVPLSDEDKAQAILDRVTQLPVYRRIVPLSVLLARLTVLGKIESVVAVLDSFPESQAKFLALQEGVYADDADVIEVLEAVGVDPSVVLA